MLNDSEMGADKVKIDYRKSKIYVAIPALNENKYIRETLKALQQQTHKNFEVFVCVNQPDAWWDDPDKKEICENNIQTLEYLKAVSSLSLTIIDKCSKGKGWVGKHCGVGMARKTLMDRIESIARPQDLIVSLDADTWINPRYLESIAETFTRFSQGVAMAVPYYHKLTDNEQVNRAILRYEIYMRHYTINMFRIESPYAFTALGSAIVVPVWVYQVVSGITPRPAGEDFYFLQKLAKYGRIIPWNEEKVFPSARPSDRVDFGTGPAVIKGMKGDWSSYPIYDYRLFDHVATTYKLFEKLFKKDISTPMTAFLKQQFGEENIWQPLRDNFKTIPSFVRACHEKVDALRILQYLKSHHDTSIPDEEYLKNCLYRHFADYIFDQMMTDIKYLSFQFSNIFSLNRVRDFLERIENQLRKESLGKPNIFE